MCALLFLISFSVYKLYFYELFYAVKCFPSAHVYVSECVHNFNGLKPGKRKKIYTYRIKWNAFQSSVTNNFEKTASSVAYRLSSVGNTNTHIHTHTHTFKYINTTLSSHYIITMSLDRHKLENHLGVNIATKFWHVLQASSDTHTYICTLGISTTSRGLFGDVCVSVLTNGRKSKLGLSKSICQQTSKIFAVSVYMPMAAACIH